MTYREFRVDAVVAACDRTLHDDLQPEVLERVQKLRDLAAADNDVDWINITTEDFADIAKEWTNAV